MPKFNTDNLKLEAWPPAALRGALKKPSKAVKVTHTPTGLYVVSAAQRSQYENRYAATKQLEAEVNQYYEDHRDE
jgi:protein subunit release factor A